MERWRKPKGFPLSQEIRNPRILNTPAQAPRKSFIGQSVIAVNIDGTTVVTTVPSPTPAAAAPPSSPK
jgi:hypothetical protein